MLFFDSADIRTIRYFIDKIEKESLRVVAERKLHEVISYCVSDECRRRRILAYFGERYREPSCAGCDACRRSGIPDP